MPEIDQSRVVSKAIPHSSWYTSAMENLIDVVQELSHAYTLDEITAVVRKAARELTGADGATFVLKENDNCFYAEENAISPLWKGHRFPMSNCISGWVMINKTPAIIEDIFSDGRIPHDVYRQTFVKSLAMVPIRRENPIGAIGNYWANKKLANDEEIAVLQMLANMTSISMENVSLYTKLKDADRRKDEFLATLAHELRNPLAPLQNALSLLQKDGTDPVMRKKVQDIMSHQLNHLVRLVDDLLDVSRINHNKIELRRTNVHLKDAINQAIETVKDSALERRHDIQVKLPKEDVVLYADNARLTQIFSNILNNAVKYTKDGGKISLAASVDKNTLTVTIADNGIGIPPEEISFIFDIFTQVDNSLGRAQGGLGIGLSLVKKLVDLHGGTVSASSAGVGKGSSFTVHLPVSQVNEPQESTDDVIEIKNETMCRVLVVDNIEESAKTLGWMIETLGCEVRVEYSGQAALNAVKTFHPHVILLDIGMPGMDGYETCRALSKIPELADTVFVAQTGWGDEKHRKMSLDAGFDHHLVKPVDLKDLEKIIQQNP